MSNVTFTKLQKGDSFADAHFVRKQVFIEEQAIPASLELDGLDDQAIHVVIKEGTTPVATGRMRYRNREAKAERVAVVKAARGKGYGVLVMNALEDYAKEVGVATMNLHAQLHAKPFYDAIGYRATSPVYEEASIPHIKMSKQLV